MKLHKRLITVMLSLSALFMLLSFQTLAAGNIDLRRNVSLTVLYQDGKTPVSDVMFNIYQVSTADESGELTPTDAFHKYSDILNIRGKNDKAWINAAETLEHDLMLGSLKNIAPTDSAATDKNGKASFPTNGRTMTPGLYLVAGTQTEKAGKAYSTSPFMVMLPEKDMIKNEWNYSVEAKAKPSVSPITADFNVIKIWQDDCHRNKRPNSITVQLICDGEAYGKPITLPHNGSWKYTWSNLEVNHKWTIAEQKVDGYKEAEIRRDGNTFVLTNICNKSTESSNPILPKTGQLWWPVPVLTAVGILFTIFGIIRRKGRRHEQ